eukprot:1479597-Rhodomonas_salina.1
MPTTLPFPRTAPTLHMATCTSRADSDMAVGRMMQAQKDKAAAILYAEKEGKVSPPAPAAPKANANALAHATAIPSAAHPPSPPPQVSCPRAETHVRTSAAALLLRSRGGQVRKRSRVEEQRDGPTMTLLASRILHLASSVEARVSHLASLTAVPVRLCAASV